MVLWLCVPKFGRQSYKVRAKVSVCAPSPVPCTPLFREPWVVPSTPQALTLGGLVVDGGTQWALQS